MPENQTAWNSGNQGVKETFTQTGVPKQRNKTQMKEQIKTPEKGLSKMDISNLSDAEFKTLVISMLKELSVDLNSMKRSNQKQRIH